MYRFFICAALFISLSHIGIAQSVDELVTEEPVTGIDEKEPLPSSPDKLIIAPSLLKSYPLPEGRIVSVSTTKTGRKKGAITISDGDLAIVTTGFKRNALHGNWISHYQTGAKLDSGSFENDIPDGEWRSWYINGKVRSIRTYSAYRWYAVLNEISRGNTRIYNHNLSKALSFKTNRFASFTSASSSFGSLPTEKTKYHPPFKYCLHHGLFMNFYPSGSVKDSGYYKDGLRDGLWSEYHPNGMPSAQGAYQAGRKTGGWKYLNRDGNLVMLAEFRQGKLLHRKHYSIQKE